MVDARVDRVPRRVRRVDRNAMSDALENDSLLPTTLCQSFQSTENGRMIADNQLRLPFNCLVQHGFGQIIREQDALDSRIVLVRFDEQTDVVPRVIGQMEWRVVLELSKDCVQWNSCHGRERRGEMVNQSR